VDLLAVESSAVARVGYHGEWRVMVVEYKGGGLYAYLHVTPEEWDGFWKAGSKGRYVNSFIKRRGGELRPHLVLAPRPPGRRSRRPSSRGTATTPAPPRPATGRRAPPRP
jgi:hypothetical protein